MDFTKGQGEIGERREFSDEAHGSSPKYRFADCFAGLGGFHVALERLGHECVFACEIDEDLRKIYRENFGILPAGDIRSVKAQDVPPHEVLCAGFPCQPFSLAGKKKGTECPDSGKLIDDVFRLVRHHRPRYVLLENVPNIMTIANGSFWAHIGASFERLGYCVEHKIYSPLQFGMPQQRLRLFVVARRKEAPAFRWPEPRDTPVRPLSEFVGTVDDALRQIEPAKLALLEKWNTLLANMPLNTSHTILASEFGATYPLDGLRARGPWRTFSGAFGEPLAEASSRKAAIQLLPHYAAENGGVVPAWLRPYVLTSRRLYSEASGFLDQWKVGMSALPNSWQKLEWRGDRTNQNLWAHTVQFRASGVRVMRTSMAPSLVAMTPTQTPIIGPKKRYLSVREAASLQALEGLSVFPQNNERAFRALGNAVNARIVHEVARAVLV